jgi:putative transposase
VTWEGSLENLYRQGLEGKNLALIVTDGCPGLAAAIQVVYPHVLHQRCWVHEMRNILEKVRKRDYEAVKEDARAIYLAPSLAAAREAFERFPQRWHQPYPRMVRQRERDLSEWLTSPLSRCGGPREAAVKWCAYARGAPRSAQPECVFPCLQ